MILPSGMDGVGGLSQPHIPVGKTFVYEFDADPFGLHLYHCHAVPLKRHIHKGLYGAFIIDPRGGRSDADEMVMVMNAFDTDFDGENEVYAVNTVGLDRTFMLWVGVLANLVALVAIPLWARLADRIGSYDVVEALAAGEPATVETVSGVTNSAPAAVRTGVTRQPGLQEWPHGCRPWASPMSGSTRRSRAGMRRCSAARPAAAARACI